MKYIVAHLASVNAGLSLVSNKLHPVGGSALCLHDVLHRAACSRITGSLAWTEMARRGTGCRLFARYCCLTSGLSCIPNWASEPLVQFPASPLGFRLNLGQMMHVCFLPTGGRRWGHIQTGVWSSQECCSFSLLFDLGLFFYADLSYSDACCQQR